MANPQISEWVVSYSPEHVAEDISGNERYGTVRGEPDHVDILTESI